VHPPDAIAKRTFWPLALSLSHQQRDIRSFCDINNLHTRSFSSAAIAASKNILNLHRAAILLSVRFLSILLALFRSTITRVPAPCGSLYVDFERSITRAIETFRV
jgi:hypothetical protein